VRLLFLPETFTDIGNAAERRLVLGREVVFALGVVGIASRFADVNVHLVGPKIGPAVCQ